MTIDELIKWAQNAAKNSVMFPGQPGPLTFVEPDKFQAFTAAFINLLNEKDALRHKKAAATLRAENETLRRKIADSIATLGGHVVHAPAPKQQVTELSDSQIEAIWRKLYDSLSLSPTLRRDAAGRETRRMFARAVLDAANSPVPGLRSAAIDQPTPFTEIAKLRDYVAKREALPISSARVRDWLISKGSKV